MKNKFVEIFENMFRLFVIVYGFTMMASIVFLYCFNVYALSRKFLLYCLIFSLVAILPVSIFFILPNESHPKTILKAKLIVFIFNEISLMPLGYFNGMWNNLKNGLLMAIVVFLVNLSTQLTAYGRDSFLSTKINNQLKQIQDNEEDSGFIIK